MEAENRNEAGDAGVLRSALTSLQQCLAQFGLVPSRVVCFMTNATTDSDHHACFPSESDLLFVEWARAYNIIYFRFIVLYFHFLPYIYIYKTFYVAFYVAKCFK